MRISDWSSDVCSSDLQVQPAAVSITNATEYGLAWRAGEIGEIGEIAKGKGLKLHMDGARFANAVAFLGCAPADVNWRGGVDGLSFGFTKNGDRKSVL